MVVAAIGVDQFFFKNLRKTWEIWVARLECRATNVHLVLEEGRACSVFRWLRILWGQMVDTRHTRNMTPNCQGQSILWAGLPACLHLPSKHAHVPLTAEFLWCSCDFKKKIWKLSTVGPNARIITSHVAHDNFAAAVVKVKKPSSSKKWKSHFNPREDKRWSFGPFTCVGEN